ncbi:MAG TPA: HAD-IC family P-type ATPase, partial [Pseudonocardiaceae bacterium]
MSIDVTGPASGLTTAEATARLRATGPNLVPEPPRPGVAVRVLAQLRDPMILLLLAAAALAIGLGDLTDTAVILAVIVLNTTVGVVQELRAERSLAALRRMSAPTARVLRDGRRVVRPAAELVPGDVVLIEAGDVLPADGTVLEAARFQVDESALTGESVPVEKAPADEVSAGTVVTRGRGVLLITRTGPDGALGRIAALVGGRPARPTPLQQRLAALGRVLAGVALALSAVVVVSGLLRGRPPGEMVLTGVSLAVAAVPESLPAVVTLALALGAHRMARRAAVVRRLPAVETLGSVTAIAVDKTGTVTEGRMVLERAWTPDGTTVTFTGSGYRPAGSVSPGPTAGLRRLLRDAVLCNDAELRRPTRDDPDWAVVGDPTEGALLTAAARSGVDAAAHRQRHERRGEVPFDSATRRMTTVHRYGPDAWLVVCKGAPEVLFDTPGLLADDPATAAAREATRAAARRFAA